MSDGAALVKSKQRLRILYDGLIYRTQVAGGINRYFANLIVRLPQVCIPSLVVCEAREVNYPSHANLQVFRCKRLGPYLLARALERYYLKASTDFERCDFDVVHPTYYFLLARRSFAEFRRPVVITVYDMIHELFPRVDFFGAHAREKRKAVMAAQAIICISENTKKDLLERYAIPESKVTVTHLATEMDASLSYGPEPVPAKPYYLYVGSRASYKNFDGMLSAFAQVVSLEPDVALCVVGKPFSKGELKRIARLGLTDHVEHYGYANDHHLAKLYRCSVAFVYPSLYEGFGIPPIEAMSCGTAVIASNCSSIPEVVGDAGLLFDPRSKSELAEMMIHLLKDATARVGLIAKGAQRAKMFSWDKVAAQTVEVYRSVSN
jgi:glycosyltransferase involved in cell wall biosynthesis